MSVDLINAALFVLAALVLLGSPGPAITALVAIGKARGFVGGLRFYSGLQVGLALAAGVSAAGLVSAVRAVPGAAMALSIGGGAYLVWLAWRIAASPVRAPHPGKAGAAGAGASVRSGFLLGVSNPKAYLAFAALMPSYALVRASASADAGLKWLLIMLVIITVDAAWLWLGGAIGQVALKPQAERAINVAMGGAILATVVMAWL